MDVLQHEREIALAEIRFAWLADGAPRRISPERLVVGPAVVVAREAEAGGKWKDQQCWRNCRNEPRRLLHPRMFGRANKQGRVKRAEVPSVLEVCVLERRPR